LTASVNSEEAEANLQKINDTLTNIQNILLQAFNPTINADGAIVAGTNIEGRITRGDKFTLHAGLTYQKSQYTADFKWSDDIEAQRRMFKTIQKLHAI
jgi:hypothetical protein